ncbi:unnamed protein product [Parnassius apollo]|uniref:(apollo) hypothetical protein n=1 Tax=Parnassius apollo TaxID=110799 RepID=A0A8S3W0C4_PARAO|nr:unnamed protein product [Parnassius apollo]
MTASRNGDQVWPDVFNQDDPTSQSESELIKVFERKEVIRKLKSKSNTSPGPDGLTYGDLRKADPGAFVLTALFNAVWRLEVVPGCWKDSNTILLHKKGPESDISNWRPIAMGDTCPKLFAAIVADRVKTWAIANRRYSTSQKGFLPYEGCYEHNFVLQETIQQARRDKGEVVVAWLDLAIHRALEHHGMPVKVRKLINSLYKNTITKVRTSEGFTDPIKLQSGVKQGCPLSPHIFNLTLEVVIPAPWNRQRASSELVFLPPSMGGGGLMPLSDLLDLYTVTHAFKMLCATDDLVSVLAREGLLETVSERLRKVPSNIDMARYLSGDLDLPRSSSRSSFWTKARSAARRIQNKFSIKWIWHREEEEFLILCGNGAAGRITPSLRHHLFKRMRLQLVQYYASKLQAKKDQGKVFEVTRKTGFSNHFLRSGGIVASVTGDLFTVRGLVSCH